MKKTKTFNQEVEHFCRVLESIPFPSVNVKRLEEFMLDLQR